MYWVIDVYWCLSSFYPSTFWEWLGIHWLILHTTTILRFSCSPAESKLHLEGYRCSRDQQTLSYHSWSSGEWWLGSEEQISASVHVFLFKTELGWLFMLFLYQRSLRFNLVDVSHQKGVGGYYKSSTFLRHIWWTFLVSVNLSLVEDFRGSRYQSEFLNAVAITLGLPPRYLLQIITMAGHSLEEVRCWILSDQPVFFSVTSPFIARCQFFCFECLMRLVGKVSVWGQDPVTQIWCSILLFHSKYTIEGGLTSRYLVKQQWIFGLLPPNGDEKKRSRHCRSSRKWMKPWRSFMAILPPYRRTCRWMAEGRKTFEDWGVRN